MTELPVILGQERHLAGVVTVPDAARDVPAVLLVNAGVMPRIGPGRLNVKLARHLAARGHVVLRLDLSGLGDSRTPLRAAPFREQAVRDIHAAIDYLVREHGARGAALCGICSGAENAYAAALEDPRVAGIFLFDGYAYASRYARLRRRLSRLRGLTVAKLFRRAAGLLSPVRGGADAPAQPGALAPPPRSQFAQALHSLVDRGVAVTLCYTSSAQYWYADQFAECFAGEPFVSRIDCRFVPDIDHLVTSLAAQRRFIALTDEWLARTCSAADTMAAGRQR